MNEPTLELTEASVVEAVDHQTSAEVDGENVILDLEKGVYYGLNPVGTQVWKRIQDPMTVGEIVVEITADYGIERERCFQDVVALLRDLEEHNLVRIDAEQGRF